MCISYAHIIRIVFYFRPGENSLKFSIESSFSREDDIPEELEVVKEKFKILERYLRKMFIVDPEKRPSIKELLEDEWVQNQQED